MGNIHQQTSRVRVVLVLKSRRHRQQIPQRRYRLHGLGFLRLGALDLRQSLEKNHGVFFGIS